MVTDEQDEQGLGASATPTGLSPSVKPASSLDGFATSIPDAEVSDRDCVSDGYEAWERGEPFDKFQYERWQEGWFVGFHGAEWKALAAAMGAHCSGFSGDYAATFIWPSGFTAEIAGDLNQHLRAVHASAWRLVDDPDEGGDAQ